MDLKNCTITAGRTFKMHCKTCGLTLESPYDREYVRGLLQGDIDAQRQGDIDSRDVKKQFMEHECKP